MEFKEFKERLKKLSNKNQQIVIGTLRRMKHCEKHEGIPPKRYSIKDNINKKRGELGITHEKILDMIAEKYGVVESRNAYFSMLKRESEKSGVFERTLDVLGMTETEARKEPKENYYIMVSDSADIKWLYNSLLEEDRQAVAYLVCALHMSEVAPEIFEFDEEDIDRVDFFEN